MPLTILRADASHVDGLAPLFDLYRRFFTQKSDLDVSARFLRERVESGESVVLAAYEGETPAGFLQLYPLYSSWYAQRQWFLSDLYVAETFRERGIGKKLVVACAEFCQTSGGRAILVEIPYSEPHLAKFYSELGFARDEVFELYRRFT